MEIKPFLHEHFLCYDDRKIFRGACAKRKCTKKTVFGGYSCVSCNFWLHKGCTRQQLPVQIRHPLHSEHCLDLFSHVSQDFICDKCVCIARGFKYSCKSCSFNLDFLCALKTNEEGRWRCEHKEQRSIIPHFIHQHELSLFTYRKIATFGYNCAWCEEPLSGRSYGCLDCNFFLHEPCTSEIPKKLKHPFHPSHHLYLQFSNFSTYCNACKGELEPHPEPHYCCSECNFWLHIGCARLRASLKNNCHEHDLTYLLIRSRKDIFTCGGCGENCNASQRCGFYRCVQCDINFHFKCALIPSEVKHRYHRHELFLKDFIREDDSGEYYCNICEEKRNSNHHVYCCEKCEYVTHIECALNEKSTNKSLPSTPKSINMEFDHGATSLKAGGKVSAEKVMEQGESEQGYPEFPSELGETIDTTTYKIRQRKMQIQHFNHKHPLNFHEVRKEYENLECRACKLDILGRAYICKECGYYLHKTCTELPRRVVHPLHPQHHLNLLTRSRTKKSEHYRCDECGAISDGFLYFCFQCQRFRVDVICVGLSARRYQGQRLKEKHRKTKISHFSHKQRIKKHRKTKISHFSHKQRIKFSLELGETRDTSISKSRQLKMQFQHFNHKHPLDFHEVLEENENPCCQVCKLEICGPSYVCKECGYYLHKTCIELLPEVLHSLHPQHPLYLLARSPSIKSKHFICDECGDISDGFLYFCFECRLFKIDVKCAGRNQGQKLKEMGRKTKILHFSHEHELVLGNAKKNYYCSYCQLEIFGLAYCCLDCVYVLHESCLEFPEKIQHPFHPLHPLVAKYREGLLCHACRVIIFGISYRCLKCGLYLHPTCLNSLRQALKFNFQKRTLDFYYFGTGCQMLFERMRKTFYNKSFSCLRCDESCIGPFYFCTEADISFHLECFPIPQIVKSTHHIHPLVLKNSFEEDNSGEYYCDICEEERFGKHHIYYCEECQGMFIAHIECMLCKVEEVLSWLVTRIRKKSVEVEEEIEDHLRDKGLL